MLNKNTTIDTRYRLISSQNEYDLFTDNKIMPLLKQNPEYNGDVYSKNYIYHLFQKSYVRWNIACEKSDLTRQRIYRKAMNVQNAWYWQSIFLITCLASLLVSGLFFGFINWWYSLYKLCAVTSQRSKLGKIWDKSTNIITIIFSFAKI